MAPRRPARHLDPYIAKLALPALAAITITTAVLALWQRKSLRGRYDVPSPRPPEDRILFLGSAAACLLLVPALLEGLPVAVAASAAAAVVVALCLWRKRSALRWSIVPWRLVLLVEGLFLVSVAVGPIGLDSLLRDGIGSPLRTAFAAAGASNLVNNLPAYLAMERVVPHDQLLPLLLGVNLGALVLPWGSLATLLWAERCRARGVHVSWVRFGLAGLVLVPLLLVGTTPLL